MFEKKPLLFFSNAMYLHRANMVLFCFPRHIYKIISQSYFTHIINPITKLLFSSSNKYIYFSCRFIYSLYNQDLHDHSFIYHTLWFKKKTGVYLFIYRSIVTTYFFSFCGRLIYTFFWQY